MDAKLIVLGSSSSGNSYILDVGNEILLIECGVEKKALLRGLDYDLSRVTACISTHKHKDHINPQTVKYLLSCGIRVFSNSDVASIYPSVNVIEPMKRVQIGGFKVMALSVPHGDCPNYAYVIDTPDNQRILFCTDAERFPYSIKGINHICIEANYSNELILDSLVNGDVLRSQSQNHMEMEECIATVKRLRHGGLQSVILVHLSSGLSDIKMFKDRFRSELGITPLIAEPNLIVELNKDEF